MGKIFDNLAQPNTALQDPNTGQDTFVGSQPQVGNKFINALKQSAVDTASGQQPSIPRLGQASYRDAASIGAPAPGMDNAMSPALSKSGKLLTLLRGGLEGAMAGRAASEQAVAESGGRRSGGAGMGFQAGVQLPFLRAAMQQQTQKGALENQQLQSQVGMAPKLNLLKILQGQSEIDKNNADAAKNTAEAGGVPSQIAERNAQASAAPWKEVGGQLVNVNTGETKGAALPVDQLNAGLAQRYQVLNPGQQLPPAFTLQPNATKSDFDRVDKLLTSTETAQGAKANRDLSNSIRQQTLQLATNRAGDKAGDKFDEASAAAASKDVETARGGDFRYRSMAGSYPGAQKGDQQAMLNLLTNHIGMTLGMQKGARITKDILNEAQASTPWLQGVKARWDSQGYLSGVVLTAEQTGQMMHLAVQQRANGWAQAIESARQGGVVDKLKIPADVRVVVSDPQGKLHTLPASQLSQAEDQGYTVAPQ